MRFDYTLKEIDKQTALEMVKRYHYSNALPSLNKHFVGFYLGEELVGVVTLGWGHPSTTYHQATFSVTGEQGLLRDRTHVHDRRDAPQQREPNALPAGQVGKAQLSRGQGALHLG